MQKFVTGAGNKTGLIVLCSKRFTSCAQEKKLFFITYSPLKMLSRRQTEREKTGKIVATRRENLKTA